MQKKLKSNIEKCQACGSNLTFNPDVQGLCCLSCKSQTPVNVEKGLIKHDVDSSNELNKHKNEAMLNQTHTMQCSNCGAQVVLVDYQTSASCPYCNTNMVASKENFEGLKPDSIIPFKFGKDKASHKFKEEIKGKWLAPSKFKKSINADEIKAYYFPAFVFDADCTTKYEGRLYNEDTERNSDGSTETVRSYFRIQGEKQTKHTNIEIEASTKLNQYELNLIRPYNFDEAYSYCNEFVYGYSLEQYNNSVNQTNLQAEDLMKQDIRKVILKSYRHDGVDYLNLFPHFYNEKYSYCVLPVYRINFSYKNKQYSNLMNGQTGKLGGSYPKSGLKITFIVLMVLLFLALPFLIFALT